MAFHAKTQSRKGPQSQNTETSLPNARLSACESSRTMRNSMPPQLTIVVPAYNEAARLGLSISGILEYLNQHFESSELIVVDDGSTDDTSGVAERAVAESGSVGTRVVRYDRNRGKG